MNTQYQRSIRGDQPIIPPVIENFEKSPLSGEAGPPSRRAKPPRRKYLGFFWGISREISGNLGKFQGFFGIFGEFSLNLTGFSLI